MKYSWPAISTGSASVGSANRGLKIPEKITESSKKRNLNLLHASNYLYSVHIISNLEMM